MDLGLTNLPVYTGLCASLLMLLHVVLMFLVIAKRGKYEINIGDGGNAEMQQAIRVQGNFVENAPIFLIGLALIELMVGANTWVLVMGAVFVIGRLLHAVGISMTTGLSMPRFIGTVASILVTVVAACYLGYTVLDRM